MVQKTLLVSGILAAVFYAALNVVVPKFFEGYDWVSQTVSELSAIDAPTRPMWVAWVAVYSVLIIAFGVGVWRSGGQNRRLRIIGALLVFSGIIGFFWPPMQLRGNEFALTDALHIGFGMVTLALMLAMMGYGATALGKGFRYFSLASIAAFLGFGVLTGIQAPGIAANLPTPTIGVWERLNIAVYLIWLIVLAVAVLNGGDKHPGK